MNNSEKTAFPTMGFEYINNSDSAPTYGQFGGVTKREYFAAKAMQGLLSIYYQDSLTVPNIQNVKYMAGLAVNAADELLSALAKTEA